LGNTDGFYAGADDKGFRDFFLAKGDINWQLNRQHFIKAGLSLNNIK
jgi:hypothetical protein